MSYNNLDKTLPAANALILNYAEIHKSKLKRNFDVEHIKFDNEDLWDLESESLNDFKAFIA